jgi:hypothetical protein
VVAVVILAATVAFIIYFLKPFSFGRGRGDPR